MLTRRHLRRQIREAWWAAHGDGSPLGYSSLLAAIAPSSAARQGLLKEYFVASDEDREAGLKLPTVAHRAVADLVKDGWIEVVITTNFDNLMEQALDAVGVPYQRITRPEQIGATTPLAHADATVIKLHGDWTDLEFRNTIDELDTYPEPLLDLLTRVFNEYGLIISGWSADWDKALVTSTGVDSPPYPLYWDSRSSKGVAARDLLARHGGHVIESESADQLFTDLLASIDALQRLAEPPLTTAMAIARLKRALTDPLRRIELRDMILDKVGELSRTLAGAAPTTARDWQIMDAYLDTMFEATKPLLALLVHGVRYDDGTHTGLWVEALQALLDRPQSQPRQLVQTVDELWQYPSLLALRTMSIEAVRQGRDDLLVTLLTAPRWDDPFYPRRSTVAADVLHMHNVIEPDFANRLPRWNGREWRYPPSHLLRTVLTSFFEDHGVDASRYDTLCDDVEYRTGLVQFLLPKVEGLYGHSPNSGEFVGEQRWSDRTGAPFAEERFRIDYGRGSSGAWADLLGSRPLDAMLDDYREILRSYIRRY